jgi:hypothetical protein
MLTMLLQGAVFGFLPRFIAQPFLDSQKLFELQSEINTPITKAYALYLTKNFDQPNVKLGLKMLGIDLA